MALGFSLGVSDLVTSHDTYSPPPIASPCRVLISCPGKGKNILAMLSGDLRVNVKSHWKSLFDGAIGGGIGKILGIIDNIEQIFGNSIRQPYFGRKYWQGTDPIKFSLSFQFVAFSNAKEEVYKPMVSLMSLLYPRKSSAGEVAGLFSSYIPPGPNLFYDTQSDASKDDGDRIVISLGNFMSFKGCYVTDFQSEIANSFSTDGYPHCVNVSMEFETMDVAFVSYNGAFMENGFTDASVTLGAFLQQLKGVVGNIRNKVGDLASQGLQAIRT